MIQLPDTVAAYVRAANDQDAARIAGCIVPDGTVRDEGKLHHGSEAIAAWARETATRYQSTIAPVAIDEAAGQCTLTATVSGNFPGSPATLAFHFNLRADGIAALEISA
ncbi:nuclear transport factor 2 family protein [Pseudoduganella umbonata]|uniref:Nuclear transport factor 2 family protein n=1 Tax=Pseudoduganella umbonata TaxID=864828 RepID=A0A4P8HKV0_9BURK|nr:nuclear transport factor 2 family protein [Pseudoduganella umbonata]MBB3221213.1 hypothetical protein [Pseudoduganella umbonata]QCP10399.1 nuclear transport factor 2 family protein [Pseudoduganella umbonata]